MRLKKNPLNATEILTIINKYYIDTNDIRLIACVGTNKANEIKKTIAHLCDLDNIKLPYGLVPSEKVVEYLGININYLKKCAAIKKDTTK